MLHTNWTKEPHIFEFPNVAHSQFWHYWIFFVHSHVETYTADVCVSYVQELLVIRSSGAVNVTADQRWSARL